MSIRRYEVCECVEIGAPLERVFAVASDPQMVPRYATEIVRIEIVDRESATRAMVRTHLKIAGLTLAFRYRYHYRPPVHYSGVEAGRRIVRGYFTLRFSPSEHGTLVTHTEGIISHVPLLAQAAGFLYYRVLARHGMRDELSRLKALVEDSSRGR